MDAMAGLIWGNQFNSPTGQAIQKCTALDKTCEDWAVFMDICDNINETEEGPQDAIKALKKRLSQLAGTKNTASLLLCLSLLETMVKNCDARLHALVAQKDFINELIQLIAPGNNPPSVVHDKVLALIQEWADAFKGRAELREVEAMYLELKSKGVEFPATDLDAMAPIHTPASRIEPQPPAPTQPHSQTMSQTQPEAAREPRETTEGKIQRELGMVETNCKVLNDMMRALGQPASLGPEADEIQLIQELEKTCRAMHTRLMDLIAQVTSEDMTNELLRINDELTTTFSRYERWDRARLGALNASAQSASPAAGAFQPPLMSQTPPQATSKGRGGERDLIELTDEMSLDAPKGAIDTEEDYKEMSNWLKGQSQGNDDSLAAAGASGGEGGAQDPEFDVFLRERTAVSKSPATAAASPGQSRDSKTERQEEDPFAL